jgi:predicted Zn-dependent peptidase
VEGQTRQFETPAALVNRYANLFVYGLPLDYYVHFPDHLCQINLPALNAALHRQVHPRALIAVVVADADQATEPLRSLDWAELEIIED